MNLNTLKKLARVKNIPPGWNLITVGEVCKIRNEFRKPISVQERKKIKGNYPYYGPTGVLSYINEFKINGKFATIGEDGDHFLQPNNKSQTMIIGGKFNINNHAHLIEGTDICSTEWFYWYFKHRDITNFLTRQGAGRYKLNKETLTNLPILVPSIALQNKLTSLFNTIEININKTEQLIGDKKRKHLFILNNQLEQVISRSKDKLTFRDLFKRKQIKNTSNSNHELLSVTKAGIVKQSDYFNKQIASDDLSTYLVVEKHDLVMSGLNFWMGAIDFQEIVDIGLVSPAYKVFELTSNADISYMQHFVRSRHMLRILRSASVQGASIVRRNLDLDQLLNSTIALPSLQEQKEIGSYLNLQKSEIVLLKKLLESYKKQKQGLMQKLLSGETEL